MQIIVIGSEKYYRRTFSQDIQKNMSFFDHIGFRPNDNSPYDLNTIMQEISDFQGEDEAIILGHSIHAFMAAEYAKRYDYKVAKVILIGCSPYTDYAAANKYFEDCACDERKAALKYNLSLPQNSFSKSDFINRMLVFGPMLWLNYQYDASHLWQGVEFHEIAANCIWGKMFQDYVISKISKPTLIVLGRHDYFNPITLWSDANVVIFENSGHTPQLEEQSAFDEVVKEFIVN